MSSRYASSASILHQVLALPMELQLMILHHVAENLECLGYITAQIPELSAALRYDITNFRRQLPGCPSQLNRILLTTIAIIQQPPVRDVTSMLRSSLDNEDPHLWPASAEIDDAVSFQLYLTLNRDAHDLAEWFAAKALPAAISFQSAGTRDYDHNFDFHKLGDIERYRIRRACLRVQLYIYLCKAYLYRKSRPSKARAYFRLLARWEFDEVRSIIEWLKRRYSFAKAERWKLNLGPFQELFNPPPDEHGMITFDNDIFPLLSLHPAPAVNAMVCPRPDFFNHNTRLWEDAPSDDERGRADMEYDSAVTVWKGFGSWWVCSNAVYHEIYLGLGFPFWHDYTLKGVLLGFVIPQEGRMAPIEVFIIAVHRGRCQLLDDALIAWRKGQRLVFED